MAKSLRSKWKRKMKAAKRVRYGEKERARLDKMLADFKESEQLKKEQGIELHRPQVLGGESNPDKEEAEGNASSSMDTSSTRVSAHRSKSLQNADGNYPVWMSQRKIQQQKEKKKRKKSGAEGKVNKRGKKKFL